MSERGNAKNQLPQYSFPELENSCNLFLKRAEEKKKYKTES